MKKFLLGTVALDCVRGSRRGCRSRCASLHQGAADDRRRSMTGAASTSAPTVVGARAASAGTSVTAGGAFIVAEGCHDATGGTAGGQIGYRWQSGAWVFGLEAQGNWADFSGSNISLGARAFTQPLEDRRVRPVHRSGRLRRQQRSALRQGRRGCDRRSLPRHWRRYPGGQSPIAATTPAGAARSAPASNTASPRTGRPRVEYDHLFMQDKTYSLLNNGVAGVAGTVFDIDAHPPGRRSRHRPRQLSLGRPGHRQVLSIKY